MKDLYEGKEQSLVKHEVLRKYLSTFAHKIGSAWDSITYIDGFSGPWNSVSADLADSSFAIALRQLRQARETYKKRKNLKLRCFFVEQNPNTYAQLLRYAEAQTDVEIRTVNASFEDSISNILSFLNEDRKTFAFTFIDPTGWTGFGLRAILPLIQFQPGEVLVNFMTNYIIRFVDHEDVRHQLLDLYGSSSVLDSIRGLQGMDRTDACIFGYCSALKAAGGFEYVSPAVVLQPTKHRPHFHLIYGTRKLVGLEVFKTAERQAMDTMEKARAAAEERRRQAGGQRGLFASEEMPESNYYVELRQRYVTHSRLAVLNQLKTSGRLSFDDAFAIALSRPLVWESDLKSWLEEWKGDGSLTIDGLQKERAPKISRGHFLNWAAE